MPQTPSIREEAEKALIVGVTDGDEEGSASLYEALQASKRPMDHPLPVLTEALATIGWWLPVAEDKRAKASGGMKLAYRLFERQLENLMKSLDKGIMAKMHQNNMAERSYHNSGR